MVYNIFNFLRVQGIIDDVYVTTAVKSLIYIFYVV